MYRKPTRVILLALLICLSVVFQSFAKLDLGGMTMSVMQAPPLENPLHLSRGAIYQQSSLANVGGVAFELEALPAESLNIQSISLFYDAGSEDGSRLIATIDSQKIYIPLYDWQLIPIAHYADSPYYACFTYFGKLVDKQQEQNVRNKGGKIVNYHPALQNTLLGLRLMQSDLMLMYNECADLPKQNNVYILGKGESAPDVEQNRNGLNNILLTLQSIESDLQLKFRSYLISDYQQDIRFFYPKETLKISGHPFYYCWRYTYEGMSQQEQLQFQKTVLSTFTNEMKDAENQLKIAFNQKDWYIEKLLIELNRYEESFAIYGGGTVNDALKLKNDNDRRQFLNQFHTSSLHDLIFQLRYDMALHEPVYLKEYSERLSVDPAKLQAINPAVWNVTTNTMRYAAFFRYCKAHFPDQWQDFLNQIAGASVEPQVMTPTVLWP